MMIIWFLILGNTCGVFGLANWCHLVWMSWHVSVRPVWPVVKSFLWPVYRSPSLLFDQDLVVNFTTYMRVYTTLSVMRSASGLGGCPKKPHVISQKRCTIMIFTINSVTMTQTSTSQRVHPVQGAAKKMTQHQKCDNSVRLENFCAKFCGIV